jgi:hypothetical protein
MLGAGGAGETAAAAGGLDIGSSVAGGGVGGGVLMVIVGLVKKAMGKYFRRFLKTDSAGGTTRSLNLSISPHNHGPRKMSAYGASLRVSGR